MIDNKLEDVNLPLYNININTLVKNYFNLYFNYKFINNKFRLLRIKRLSLNKIFVSKVEIKYTNFKATVTIYTYNREKLVLLKKIKIIKVLFFKKILSLLYSDKKLNQASLRLKTILTLLYKELILFRRFKLKLSLNKYKFEERFLYKLSKLISNFYNKKVEFNLINMKSIILNSDFFTKILSLKLKDRKVNIIRLMNIILNKSADIFQKSTQKNIDTPNFGKIYKIIFNSIKYKDIGGIRLEIKGRLTKRRLKNIDSSYKGLSFINLRGFIKPNVEYSIYTSKRRIRAFVVKG
ncbi:hypothetical protein CONLIGDRAFT_658171 [Coniochaeta ligniaria NRRL 30616]|uniref:Small ribosomal subunit protein uS3m n=1 Tax=Coniochaeta ligniaria NRRL 30616 TaxID=1408157 RepID=A0A1J7IYD5_9PEZI|nr:hypothetical protein CONLIGDRAFT_658171 [Coniochaeta ligniaria NRRL 30616]